MCIHDGTLDRTTNGTGLVSDYTLTELKTFSAWNNRKGFEAETIPTLSELAAILPDDVALALELKTDAFLNEETAHQLINTLQSDGIHNRTLVISFSKARVLTIHRLAPDIPPGLISMSGLRPDPDMQILGPFWPLLFLNPFYAKRAKQRGQIVCPLDPTPEPRLWFYQKIKVDAILTDNPKVTCQRVRKYEDD
jgi:glycerophosphoryl diester phosphodiesterase